MTCVLGTGGALAYHVAIDVDHQRRFPVRTRLLATAAFALLVPATMFAAPSANRTAATVSALPAQSVGGDDCGRGNAWGCRRNREDDRYDNRQDRDRYDRDRYERGRDDRGRYDRDRYESDRWERERFERARYERERYERERYAREREEWEYRHRDRRYSRYDGYPVACVRAGGRVLGGAVLTICTP